MCETLTQELNGNGTSVIYIYYYFIYFDLFPHKIMRMDTWA